MAHAQGSAGLGHAVHGSQDVNKSKLRRGRKAAAKAARIGDASERSRRAAMALVALTLSGKGNVGATRAERRSSP